MSKAKPSRRALMANLLSVEQVITALEEVARTSATEVGIGERLAAARRRRDLIADDIRDFDQKPFDDVRQQGAD